MLDQITIALESFKDFWGQLIHLLPQLLIGIALLVVGWLVAKVLRAGLKSFMKLIRLDVAAEKAGIEDFLLRGGVRQTSINIIAGFVYWFLIVAFTLAFLHSLGLDAAKDLFYRMVHYIPDIVVAVLVMIFGTLLSKLIRGVFFTYLKNIGVSGAEFMSNIVYWAAVLLTISLALQQLSLGGQLLISAFEIAFGGLCLALALAFGMAGKEWASQILEKLWRHSR